MAQSAPLDLGIPGLEDAILLGRGGFAVVYRAYQPAFRRTVAVKVVSVTHVDELTRERFRRECQAMGLLSEHPSIVTVLEAGFLDDGRPYLVMAYMPEGSLQDRLRQGPLGWQEATRIGVKLAGALGTAHQAGVLHRDVKPANVLVSQYGEPQLSDFGIARVAGGQETSSGVITASLAYAPPEIVDGQRPSVASDVYSLGATVHALMAGSAPFWRDREDSVAALINRVMNSPPPDLRQHGVPGNVAEVLEQAMAKDPQDRPASAAQFGRLLRLAEDENGLRPTQLTVYKPADEPPPITRPTEPPPTEMAPTAGESEDFTDSPTDVVDTAEMLTAATAVSSAESPPGADEATATADQNPPEGQLPGSAATVVAPDEAKPDEKEIELPPTATVATAAAPEATADLAARARIDDEPEPAYPGRRRSVWFAIAAVVGLVAVFGGYLLARGGAEPEAAVTTTPVGTTVASSDEAPSTSDGTTTPAVDTEPASSFDFPEWWLTDPDWSRAELVDHATHDYYNFVAGDHYGESVWFAPESPAWSPEFEDGVMTVATERGETDFEGIAITSKRMWRAPTTATSEYAAVFRLVINELGDGLEIFIERTGADPGFRYLSLAVESSGRVAGAWHTGGGPSANFELDQPITLETGASYDIAFIAEGGGVFNLRIWPSREPNQNLEDVAGIRLDLEEIGIITGGWDPGVEVGGGTSVSIDEYWGFELPGGDTAPRVSASVGMVFDIGGRGDQSFNDAAAAGLDRAIAELGIETSEATANEDGSNRGELVLQQAEQSDLVLAIGWTFADAVRAAAEANPNVSFAIVDDASIELPNVANLTFAEAEGSYLVGVAAALKTTDLKVGFIGGVDWELIHRFEAGFTAGVHAVNSEIPVDVQYISEAPDMSGFDDIESAREIALSMYVGGVDVIYHAAGGSGEGLFRAAREYSQATGTKVWAIGVDSDQYLTADEELRPYILTSMVKRVDVAVFSTIHDLLNGVFSPGLSRFDLAVDGVGYATSGGFIDDITGQLEVYKSQIVNGSFQVPETP